MALLETVTSWKEGVDAFTQKDYGGSLQSFSEIPDPSARILFNIACVLLKLNRREEALKNLEACLNKDPHLAIGHYHKGVQNLKLKRHREADTDFENAIEKMRGCAYIDYAQLGMVTKLHTYQIQSAKAINLSQRGKTREAIKVFIDASQDTDEDEFKRHAVSCIHELKEGKTLEPEELCPNCLFLPPKNLIANLQKREYIGKAKVISSYEKDNNKNRNNQTDTPRQGRVPPPPSRAPPTLQLRPAKSAEDLRSPALLLPKPPPKSQLRKHSADQDEVKPRPKRPQRPPLPSNLSDRSDKSDKSIYEPLSRSMDDLFDESLYEDAATSSRVSQPKGRKSIDNELTKALATKFGKLCMASPVDKNAIPSIKVDDYDCENTEKDRTRNEGHVLSNKDANVSKCRKPFKISQISGDSVGFKTSSSTGNLESVNPSPLSSANSKSAECLSEGKVMKAKHASGVTDLNFSSKKPLLPTSHNQFNGKSILSTEKHQPQGLKIPHSEENVATVAVGLSSKSKHISQKTQPFSYLVSEEKVKKQLPTHSPPPNRQPPLLQTPTASSKHLSPKTGSPPPNQQPPLLQTPSTSSKQSPKTRTSPPNQAPPLLSTIPNDLQQSTTDSDPPNKPPLLHTLMADTKQSPKTCSPPPNRAPPLLRTPSDDLQKSCLSPISSTPPNPKPSLLSISTDTSNQSPKSPTFSPLPHRQPLVLQDSATSSKQFPKSPKSVPPNRPPQPAAINLQKLSSAPKIPSSPVLLSTTNKELFQCRTVRLPKTNEKPTPSTTEKIRSPLRVKFSLSEESSVNQISEIPIAETSNMDVQTVNIIDHQDADLDIHSPNNNLRKEAGKASKNASTASSPIRQIKSMGDLGKVVTNSAKVIGTNLKTSVSAVITAVKKSPKKLNFPKVLVKNKRNKNSYASLKRSRSADDLYSHIGQFSERSLDDIYLDIIGDPDYVNIGRSNSCDIIVKPVDGVVEYINMGSSDIDGQLADDGLDYINIMSITSNETEEGISAITKTNNMAAIPSADGMGAITKTDNMAAITKVDNMAAITKANMPSIYTDVVFTTNYNIQSSQDDQLPSITTANKMPSIYTDVVFTTHHNTQSSQDDQLPSITTAEDIASITSTDDMAAITIGDNMATISSSADSISKTPDNTSARDNQRNDSPGKVKELQKIFDSKLKKKH